MLLCFRLPRPIDFAKFHQFGERPCVRDLGGDRLGVTTLINRITFRRIER